MKLLLKAKEDLRSKQGVAVFVVICLVSAFAACSSPPEQSTVPSLTTPTIAQAVEPSALPTVAEPELQLEETSAPESTESAEPQDNAAEAPVEPSAGFEPRPHRDQPAPPGEYVADSAAFFGSTQKPQLIEIFTYW